MQKKMDFMEKEMQAEIKNAQEQYMNKLQEKEEQTH